MKNFITVIYILFSFFVSFSQEKDKNLCELILETSLKSELYKEKINNVVIEVGKNFIFFPYKSGVLEKNEKERLVINLRELDCVTFVENTIAISNLIKSKKNDFSDFKKELQLIRYRNGEIKNYSSRLHYFSDWIFENEKNKKVKDITKILDGEIYKKNINFISRNKNKYKGISDENILEEIRNIENNISKRKYYFIPKNKISKIKDKIKDGDIIAITLNIKNLDIAHVGIAIWENSKLHLLHASSRMKKIVISKKTLDNYILNNKQFTGLMVVRPQF
ncbi:MAG: hypothetical protein B6I24_01650 [Bacteroidetes bacterium 4572_128]|nr:MAG: hypothetical protein B6I24_01650 [Bacteroidetes bacterium 4572_128]